MSILYFRRIGLPEVHAWSTNVIWSGRASHSFSRYHSRKTIDNICVIVHRHNTHHTRRMTATWSVCRQWSKCGGGVPVNTIFRQQIIVQNRAVRHQSCRHLATGETWTSKRRFTPTIGGSRLWRPTLKKQQQYAANPTPTVCYRYEDKSNWNRAGETRRRRFNTASVVHSNEYTDAGYLYVHGETDEHV